MNAATTSNATSPSFAKICALAVHNLVLETHRRGVLYASDDWSPLSDITLALLLARSGIRWRHSALNGLVEIVWPPVCGIYVMHIEPAQTAGEKRFALRHGLGHVLARHVKDLAFARGGHDAFAYEEQVADLFALVDLIPDRQLAELRGAGYTPAELERWVTCAVNRYAPSWPLDRVRDRVMLRLTST